MARSGTTTYNATGDTIIARALRLCGVAQNGVAASTTDKTNAYLALNALVKSLQNEGYNLWAREWIQKTLTPSSVVIGKNGKAYECISSHTSSATDSPSVGDSNEKFWLETSIISGSVWAEGSTYSSGDVIVGSDSNQYICIKGHVSTTTLKPVTGGSYATYWTAYPNMTYSVAAWVTSTAYAVGDIVYGTDDLLYKCTSAHTSGASTTPITGGSYAGVWTLVHRQWATSTAYTSIGDFTLADGYTSIIEMSVVDGATSTPIELVDLPVYFQDLSYKPSFGRPYKAGIDRQFDDMQKVYLYPFPSSATEYVIHMVVKRELQDAGSAGSGYTMDFPKSWENVLVYGLASDLADEYGISLGERQMLDRKYEKYKYTAKGADRVNSSEGVEGAY